MDVLKPTSLRDGLILKAERPEAVAIAGGTDLLVELNAHRRRLEAMIDVSHLPELREWRREGGSFVLGAGVTYARIVAELGELASLMQAARTVGSPPIRVRGTVGGNLGTASPAGDALPVPAAYDAEIVLASATGTRSLPWYEFLLGPKRTALRPDELIVAARWPLARRSRFRRRLHPATCTPCRAAWATSATARASAAGSATRSASRTSATAKASTTAARQR
jgi:CO/xanthine dehydrogenase FAD-binding subunit